VIFRRPNPLIWSVAALLALAAFIATYVVFVRGESGQEFDNQMLVAAEDVVPAGGTRAGALAFLSNLPLVSAGIAVIALIAALAVRRLFESPVVALVTALAAAATTQILKAVLTRPDLGISQATMNSFPSGHTTLAAAAMFAAVLVTSPRWRPVVATLGGLFAATAAASTYVLGWHRPSDVIGAVLVAGMWALVGGAVILAREPQWNSWNRGERTAPSGVWLGLPWIPAVVGLAAAAVLWWFVLKEPTRPVQDLSAWYVVAGLSLVLGATMAVFGSVSALLAHQARSAD